MAYDWEKELTQLKKKQKELKELAKEQSSTLTSMWQSFAKSADEQAEASQKNIENAREQVRVERDIIEAKIEIGNLSEEEERKLKEQNAALREKNALLAKQEAKLKAIYNLNKSSEAIAGSFANALMMQSNHTVDLAKGFASSYIELVKNNKMANVLTLGLHGLVKTAVSLGGAFARAFSPMNIASSLIEKIKVASIEFLTRSSAALANFSAAVGDAGEMKRAVAGAMDLGAGVNIEQASTAAAGLATSLKSLTTASPGAQTAMINSAAKLERLGISASQSGAAVEMMTRSMGMSGEQAMETMEGMASAANAFGQTSQQYLQNWSSMMPSLMAHGKDAKKVFEGLAAQAKSAGLEMEVLYKAAGKFDTFDSAASSVGNLNAILGGDYLNSLEMINMNESERIDALKRAFEMNGKTFDQMERFERKAIAEQLGVAEGELAQMMGISTRESREAARQARQKERDEERRRKLLTATVDIMTRLQNLMQSLFAKSSVMNALTKAFDKISKTLLTGETGKMIREITGALADLMADGIMLVADGFVFLIQKAVGIHQWFKTKIPEALGFMQKKWESLQKWFKTFTKDKGLLKKWEGIATKAKGLWDKLKPIFRYIKNLFVQTKDDALNSFGEMDMGMGKSFESMIEGATKFIDNLLDKMEPLFNLMEEIGKRLESGAIKPVHVWQGFLATLASLWDTIRPVLAAGAEALVQNISFAFKSAWMQIDIMAWLKETMASGVANIPIVGEGLAGKFLESAAADRAANQQKISALDKERDKSLENLRIAKEKMETDLQQLDIAKELLKNIDSAAAAEVTKMTQAQSQVSPESANASARMFDSVTNFAQAVGGNKEVVEAIAGLGNMMAAAGEGGGNINLQVDLDGQPLVKRVIKGVGNQIMQGGGPRG